MSSPEVVGLVPARGGSKGLPGKNLQTVAGRSLVARAVEAGLTVPSVDLVVVSSDDAEILAEGQRSGAQPSLRPAHLATDHAATIDLVLWELTRRPGLRTVVLLQPTSPLRHASDIQACLDVHDEGRHPVVTVTSAPHPPTWTFERRANGTLRPVLGWDALAGRRQDAPGSYVLNGAVYVGSRRHLESHRTFLGPTTRTVVMPMERSVDIDTELDLRFARMLATVQEESSR